MKKQPWVEVLIKGSHQVGIDLTDSQIDQFLFYLEELQKWNQKFNLVGYQSQEEIIIEGFLGSLAYFKSNKISQGQRAIDIGSGAGFPGLPIKIAEPSLIITLNDSSRKKTLFLNELCWKLNLTNIEVSWARVEVLGQKLRGKFDLSFGKGVARLSVLLEYALPLLKVGGYLIIQKGEKLESELLEALKALKILGGEIDGMANFKLPFCKEERRLAVIRKVTETPPKFPRRPGIPTKRPLGKF